MSRIFAGSRRPLVLGLLLLTALALPASAILPPFDFLPGLAQPMGLGPGDTTSQTLFIHRNTATCTVCQPNPGPGAACCTSTIFVSLENVPAGVSGCVNSPSGCLTTPVPGDGPHVVLSAEAGLVPGDFTLKVKAQALDGPNPRTQFELIPVHLFPFSLGIPPNLKVGQGQQAVVPLTVRRIPGFTAPIDAVLVGAGSAGVAAQLGFGPDGDLSELVLEADPTAAPGSRAVSIQLTAGAETRTFDVPFQVVSPFSLSVNPANATLLVGASQSFALSLQRGPGFFNPVGFALTAPAGFTGTFSPLFTTASTSTLNLTAAATLVPGTYNLSVRATGAGVVRTKPIQVVVKRLRLTSDVPAGALAPNTSNTIQLTIERGAGLTGTVTLAASIAPFGQGVGATVTPLSTNGDSATLTLHASRVAEAGSYTVTVTASLGGTTETLTLPVLVVGSGFP